MGDEVRSNLAAHLPRLRRFAWGLAGSRDEGDDLVQAACEKALARSHQFTPGSRLDSWLFRIVQTTWVDRLRQRRTRRTEADDEALAAVPDGRGHAGEIRLALGTVERAIAALPEEQRSVLLLVSIDGASYREAAEILDIPIGTVMSRLARARLALGRALDGQEQGKDDGGRPVQILG
ncbi:RNA polymerase sigma factor [Inquilinus sp. Marseille-Q2685]|uniref:RNA polymerase sigma factor n=1 Tax=Inquilinus sp. Marseille-Q2685 TaxID=2866581 RepID=UPI001CE3FF92|nr:RNA polymerase sigma factor [Inquilinus sp. Marseille-Q2685]